MTDRKTDLVLMFMMFWISSMAYAISVGKFDWLLTWTLALGIIIAIILYKSVNFVWNATLGRFGLDIEHYSEWEDG